MRLSGRLALVLSMHYLSTTWRRRLLMVTHRHSTAEALVVPDGRSAVYCLPGRGGIIVCTSRALVALASAQLQAVLAHERAHVRGRHDQVLVAAGGLRAAFPFVPALRVAGEQLVTLVEMRADDAAAVAAAVSCWPVHSSPWPRLRCCLEPSGLAGRPALVRVCWLTAPRHPVRPAIFTLAAALTLVVLASPLGSPGVRGSGSL